MPKCFIFCLYAQREARVGGTLKFVREAKFYDETGCINFAIWDILINELKPKTSLKFSNITTNFWNGRLKLTTTVSSTIQPGNFNTNLIRIETNVDEKEKESTVLCCPEVVAVKLEEYFSCRNIICRKKISIGENKDSKFVKCLNCDRKMVTKNLKHTFIVEVFLEKKNGKQSNVLGL